MLIQSIDNQGHLYAVQDVFPVDLLSQMMSCAWAHQPYQRLEIGLGLRRCIDSEALFFEPEVHKFVFETLRPSIEVACGVKFVDNVYRSLNWWMDEPGFRPMMHCDGDLPSALQIYLQPNNDNSLGTTFFNSPNQDDVMHQFPSVCNSGYLMFNKHSGDGVKKMLWHDMERAVPKSVYRVCCYITLGSYEKL
jgi:hypothetical protein